jgi:hypothetical protein
MTTFDPFEVLRQQQLIGHQEQAHRLTQIAQPWESPIRAGLQRLAQALWPDQHVLGLLPVHRYRLRHQATATSQVGWVEHDIPPSDRYWCAAYRVQMTLPDGGEPILTVQSGTAVYPVTPSVTFPVALFTFLSSPP